MALYNGLQCAIVWSHIPYVVVLINVKKTTFYTHVNGHRRSHIENSKNKKKL